jgi:hypothetical protein
MNTVNVSISFPIHGASLCHGRGLKSFNTANGASPFTPDLSGGAEELKTNVLIKIENRHRDVKRVGRRQETERIRKYILLAFRLHDPPYLTRGSKG